MIENDEVIKKAVKELIHDFKCHTIILYGSRARGDFTNESDYDIIGFSSEVNGKVNYAKEIHKKYLDAFIYSDKINFENLEEFLHIKDGIVLIEKLINKVSRINN